MALGKVSLLAVLAVAGACRAEPAAVSPSPPRGSAESRPEPSSDGGLEGTEPDAEPLEAPREPAPPAPPTAAAKGEEEEPREVRFGVPLPLGLYAFPDGLRLRFSATHECEYDSTAPCSHFEVVAWFKGREARAALLWGRPVRIVGHSVLLTEDQSLIVRK